MRKGEVLIDQETIATSAGVSAGIDMVLLVPERMEGPDVAQATAREIDYDHWK